MEETRPKSETVCRIFPQRIPEIPLRKFDHDSSDKISLHFQEYQLKVKSPPLAIHGKDSNFFTSLRLSKRVNTVSLIGWKRCLEISVIRRFSAKTSAHKLPFSSFYRQQNAYKPSF